MKTRTRFAPSPTGFLHIGSLRTALYAYALAKHESGDFILRIEDTDQKREVEGAVDALQSTLKKFDIKWDEFYVQSERHKTGLYEEAAKKLIQLDKAFYCQCQAKNAKETGFSTNLRDQCRDKGLTSGAIKLKVPNDKVVSYFDFVHQKEIKWNTNDVYDATLLKSDGFPTYHLAAMVDDLDMKVSHILRGHDWLPSTPIHLLVFEFLGSERPEIGHLTDILSSSSGKKLSKRRDSVFCEQFLEDGILSEALLNFVMLLGWAPNDNRELFTLEEFIRHFNINGFGDANPRFLEEKLLWFNGLYIRQMSNEKLAQMLHPFIKSDVNKDKLLPVVNLVKDRIRKLSEFDQFAGFFFTRPIVDTTLLGENYVKHLEVAVSVIESITEWSLETLNEKMMDVVKRQGFKTGEFFMDLRVIITGKKFTPPINESMILLGKQESLVRLKST